MSGELNEAAIEELLQKMRSATTDNRLARGRYLLLRPNIEAETGMTIDEIRAFVAERQKDADA